MTRRSSLATLALLALILCLGVRPAFPAGSVVQSLSSTPTGGLVLTFTWTGDASDGSVPNTETISAYTTAIHGFYLFAVETDPGSTAPTDNYDLRINSASGVDLMGNALANRDTANTEIAFPSTASAPVTGPLTLVLTNNSVNSATGTVKLHFIRAPGPGTGVAGGGGAGDASAAKQDEQTAELQDLNTVLGDKTDAKSTATDTTSVSVMQVLKQISASVQAPPSQAVTNAGTFPTQASQAGTWNITNVSGTVSLPTGASTAAKQPALGTAGSASSDVISVQGIASMTPLLVTASAGTNLNTSALALEATLAKLTVAQGASLGSNTQALIGGSVTTAAPSYTNGQISPLSLTTAGLLRVAVEAGSTGNAAASATGSSVPSSADYQGLNVGGTLRGQTGLGVGSHFAGTVAIVDSDGNQVSSFGGSGGTASNYGSAFPSSGTASGWSDGTNMQGPRVFDVDSGGGTQYVAGVNLRKISSGGSVEAGTASDPLRVDPTGTTTQPVSGTVTANAGTNLNTSALALEASLVKLPLTQGSTTSGQSGPLIQGAVTTSAPTYTTSQTSPLSLQTDGSLRVAVTNITSDVAHDVAATSVNPLLVGGYASAAAPSDVSADGDSVRSWHLRNGAQAIQSTFAGVLATTGNGVSGTGVQRVTLASDSTGQVALATGSNTIGALTANQSVNIAQMNGVTTTMGNGASGTGVQRVTIASDSTGQVALAAGSATVGKVGLVPATSGGLTTYHLVSAASTNATVVKGSAGQLYGWYLYNANAAARKVAFHNTASTPTAGSSVFFSIVLPPTSGANVFSEMGVPFSTGIAITTVTELADNGTTAVASGDLLINLFYN